MADGQEKKKSDGICGRNTRKGADDEEKCRLKRYRREDRKRRYDRESPTLVFNHKNKAVFVKRSTDQTAGVLTAA